MAAKTGMNRTENKAELRGWAVALTLSSNAVLCSRHPASQRWPKSARIAALLRDAGISIPMSLRGCLKSDEMCCLVRKGHAARHIPTGLSP